MAAVNGRNQRPQVPAVVANLPVTEDLSAAQIAALQSQLTILGIVVAIAAIIITTRRD